MNRITHTGILVAVLLISGLFTVIAFLPPSFAQPECLNGICVVDEDGEGGANNCEDSTPAFTTIQAAIGAAAPGDSIFVCPGTYNEHVDANVASIKLLGWGCGRTIIDPPAGNVISVLADGITIDSFELTGGVNGIETSSGVPISFTMINHNCIHDNTPEDGINIDKGSNNIIRSNDVFKNADEGIFLGDSTNVSDLNWIGNNKVHNNGANGITMQVTSSTGNEIDGNDVRDNGPSNWGIDVNSDILVEHNIVVSNRAGILAQGDGNTFFANTSNDNDQEGFRTLPAASMNTFDKNTAKGNALQGFSNEGSMNTFTKNMALMNTLEGFLTSGPDNTFTENKAKKNLGDGFRSTGDGNIFKKNRGIDNDGWGILLATGSDNNVLEENIARLNGVAAFTGGGYAVLGSNNALTSNLAKNNVGGGFEADVGSTNTFTSNTAKNNGGIGFRDLTVGGGTAGTANTYVSNICSGNVSGDSSPLGLCAP